MGASGRATSHGGRCGRGKEGAGLATARHSAMAAAASPLPSPQVGVEVHDQQRLLVDVHLEGLRAAASVQGQSRVRSIRCTCGNRWQQCQGM